MMRARNRHSASNYLFAAFLELVIMALFVIIAQPQLREAVFELLEPSTRAVAVPSHAEVGSMSFVDDARSASDDPAALEPARRVSASGARSAYGGPLVGTVDAPSTARPLPAQPVGWSMNGGGSAPFEQFESFAVSSTGAAMPTAPRGAAVERRVAGYAPTVGATQLDAIDWNIAAAAQSPRPLSGWTASRPAEADYRSAYPPPYGTQSQWK